MSKAKEYDHYTLSEIMDEIKEQPPFRAAADREMDYCDGNQLDNETLQAQRDLGIPSLIENLIGPTMIDIEGMEAKNRTDWLVQADDEDDEEGEKVAKATSYRLNQAEKRSGADRALVDMYASLNRVGIGFVEVGRETNPFKYPYRVEFVHRNEVYWDWYKKKRDWSDARWMLRRRWSHVDSVVNKFPDKEDIIRTAVTGWGDEDQLSNLYTESGGSTDLYQSLEIERGWSVEEQEWRDPASNRVCVFQLDMRTTEQKEILILRNGRKIEFNLEDSLHLAAVSQGYARIELADVPYIDRTIFVGPHVMQSERLEFDRYPIVGAVGRCEDRTNIPFGTARWLMCLQDEVNARVSKMQWLLGSVVTKRTKGAVMMTDEVFRQMVSRPDADIVLNQEHMAQPGAMFEIDRNPELSQQQYNRLLDLRESIKRISGVSDALSGDGGPDTAKGLSQAIEQSVQALATLNDNFAFARTQVGEMLLKMIVKDIGREQEDVFIKGNALQEPETITLNLPTVDENGQEYLTNDVQRTMLKVTLDDQPSTQSFKEQQLASMTEVMKSSDQQYKNLMMPHFMNLTNIPKDDKEEIVKAMVELNKNGNITPEQVKQQVDEAVKQAQIEWQRDLKERELDMKEEKTRAEVSKISTEEVNNKIESIYSAVQAALQILSGQGVADAASQVLDSSGFKDMDRAPIVAEPGSFVDGPVQPVVQQNTSPMFPPRVQEPDVEQVPDTGLHPMDAGPGQGINEGIEAGGVQ